MRLWSIHPKYLDTKGLLALWRESLLAKHVLEGKTKGYKSHPQLLRFKFLDAKLDFINLYLEQIYLEATNRNYNFSKEKFIANIELSTKIKVTKGQVSYEFDHLMKKLKKRDVVKFEKLKYINPSDIELNPIFEIIEGEIESWEKV